MDPNKLSAWSVWVGCLGVLLYIIAFVMLWQGSSLFGGKFEHKDLYYAGSGFLYIAIWFKLGAIYHKGGPGM